MNDKMAQDALNEAAASLLDMVNGGLKTDDQGSVMEAMRGQTHALIGIGYLLEAILEELRSR